MFGSDQPEDSTAVDEQPRRRRKWPWIVLLTLVGGPLLIFGLWTAIALAYTYSRGDRAGYVQKFSEKGWLCKTWEGELAMVNVPGALQERFEFTVRDDSIAAEINALQGRRVSLHYAQHPGVPLSCLGDTEYFVDGVRLIEDSFVPGERPVTPSAPRRDTIDAPPAVP